MSVNKTEIQKMIDFLESYPTPIQMESATNCAACLIGEYVYGLFSSFYGPSVYKIVERTGLDRDTINTIFCNALDRKTTEEKGDTWVYSVDNACDVTKEMVINQLKTYL